MKYLLLALFTVVVACQRSISSKESKTLDYSHIPSKKGVCWVGGDSISMHNLADLASTGANWLSQTPFAWQDGVHDPDLKMETVRVWWGEADKGLSNTAKLAQAHGIKTMLKPHIWIRNANGKWRSDLEMNSDKDWDEWFNKYERMILHYAKVAEASNMEALCIGTELYQTTIQRPERWRAIIKNIREIYSGEITYAANWYREYEEITFWDDLDYIGIQAYFPLSDSNNPDKGSILKQWAKHKKKMSALSTKYAKQVVFTEIGYKNTSDSAVEPWTWPQNLDKAKLTKSDETQINLYEAMFESLFHEPWIDGFFIWKWFHSTHQYRSYEAYYSAREARYDSVRLARGWEARPKVYFSPQRTQALEVLKTWYQKRPAD